MRYLINKKRLAFIILLLGSLPTSGQNGPCAVKLADLPPAAELMGFRLSMTMDQVKVRVPRVVFGPTDKLGVSKTTINPDFDSKIDKSTFVGLRSISLDFLDGRVSSLWLGYDSTFKWHSVDDFVKGISRSLRLPDAWISWRTRGLTGQLLNCADFQMTVSIIAEGPSLRIVDKTAEGKFTARREALEEQQSAAATDAVEPHQIIADTKSKTYYPEGCQPAKEIDHGSRAVFKSAEEAEKAGYKKAQNCQ